MICSRARVPRRPDGAAAVGIACSAPAPTSARPAPPAVPATGSSRRCARAARANRSAERVRPSRGRHVLPTASAASLTRTPTSTGRRYVIGADDAPPACSRASIRPATSSRGATADEPRCRRSSSDRTSTRCPSGGNFDGDLGSLSALGALEALVAARRPHAASARDGRLGARGRLRLRPRPRLQPHRRRRRHAGGHGRGLERAAARRRDPQDRRRSGSHPRGARAPKGIASLLPRAAHRAGRHARARRRARSASSKASSRSTATTRRSPASPTTPAPRRSPSGTTRCWRPRISRSRCATPSHAMPGRQVGTVGHIEVTPNSPNVIPGLARLSIELRDLIRREARRR
mgnify:CR=1 FL=1